MIIKHIHTGGTISMAPGPGGLTPVTGLVEKHIEALCPDNITLEKQVLDPLIDSAESDAAEWNRIIATIAAAHDHIDGCIITHGTDSMAYAAAALCLALEGLDIPVIMTGSMRGLGQPDNDGDKNLALALRAVQEHPAGVWLAFAGKILPGNSLIKRSSKAFDAFTATRPDSLPCRTGKSFRMHTYARKKIATLAVTPGLSGDIIRPLLTVLNGLVLRCYGAGSAPNHTGLTQALKEAVDGGTTILAVSQCIEDGLDLSTYAASSGIRDAGVIDGGDMTSEMAMAKLALVLSESYTPEQRASLLTTTLCGEKE